MYPNRPGRNVCRILPVGLLLVLAANSLLADSFTITGIATFSDISGIHVGDPWTGTLITDGTCSMCTLGGGLISVAINMYGDIIDNSDVESATFDRLSGGLTLAAAVGPGPDIITTVDVPHTFDFTRPESLDVNGTYGISAGSSVPEPAGIVLLGTILAMTFVTLRKKKAIGS